MEQEHFINLEKAFFAETAEEFLQEAFPPQWGAITARILETGAEFAATMNMNGFAPGWSCIPKTVRYSKTGNDQETYFKSMIFRVHDFLHQLWGLPVPRNFDDDKEREYFKRMWMCAEITVLTVVEFFYCQWLFDTQPHLQQFLIDRNTLLFKRTTTLSTKTMKQTAIRLDGLLHKKTQPSWVTENRHGLEFCADFVPMLAYDRVNIDHDWCLLKAQSDKSYLDNLANQSYSERLDGLELTCWMIDHFEHLLDTSTRVDRGLQKFNRERRMNVKLPDEWNNAPVDAPKHTPSPTGSSQPEHLLVLVKIAGARSISRTTTILDVCGKSSILGFHSDGYLLRIRPSLVDELSRIEWVLEWAIQPQLETEMMYVPE